jgi:predicted SPOUT superfamily RNA methylase MTH1
LTHFDLKLAVALPDTLLEDHTALREKTVKLGQIARTCAIYGVDVIQIFRDPRGGGETSLIRKVLEYLETPQYLRKRLYKLDESLRYAGVLPPLRIPSHKPKVPVASLAAGELREGFVLQDGRTVDVGLESHLTLVEETTASRRVTVRILSSEPFRGRLVSKFDSTGYWGYSVETKEVDGMLGDPAYRFKIATSRKGVPLESAIRTLSQRITGARSVLFIFGSPSRGLFEIIGRDLKERVDLVINLFVEQHVATVRTEEAIAAALSLVNVLIAQKSTKV